MRKTRKNPSRYIEALHGDVSAQMTKLDRLIATAMKVHSRVVWEGTFWGSSKQTIISYGDFNTTRPGGKSVSWFMIGLALQKNYFSIYINAVEDKQYLSERYGPELGKVRIGKASISFRSIDDVDLAKLKKIVTKARKLLDSSLKEQPIP